MNVEQKIKRESQQNQNWFFEKINKVDKSLSRSTIKQIKKRKDSNYYYQN